jgi:hypothetical protein
MPYKLNLRDVILQESGVISTIDGMKDFIEDLISGGDTVTLINTFEGYHISKPIVLSSMEDVDNFYKTVGP